MKAKRIAAILALMLLPGCSCLAAELSNAPVQIDRTKPKSLLPPQAFDPAAQKAMLLHGLFERLSAAPDPETSAAIAAAIERVWIKSGSDAADLLMGRALTALRAKDNDLALSLLNRIVVLTPDWAEGWHKRANARFLLDDQTGSMADILRVLQLEPRHFGALAGMGMLLIKQELSASALKVFSQLLEIYPHLENYKNVAEKLRHELEGQSL